VFRYTQGDPAGLHLAGGYDGINLLYGYAKNAPSRFVDARGLVPTAGCTPDESAAINSAVNEAARRQPSCAPCAPARPGRPRPDWWTAFFSTTYHCSPSAFAPSGFATGKCGWSGAPNGTLTLTGVSLVDPLNRSGKCPCLPSLVLEEVGHLVGFSHGDASSGLLDRMCFPECRRWERMGP